MVLLYRYYQHSCTQYCSLEKITFECSHMKIVRIERFCIQEQQIIFKVEILLIYVHLTTVYSYA